MFKTLLIVALCFSGPTFAQSVAPVPDASIPETSQKFEFGRGTNPGIEMETRPRTSMSWDGMSWSAPMWSPSPTPQLYPSTSQGPAGETLPNPTQSAPIVR